MFIFFSANINYAVEPTGLLSLSIFTIIVIVVGYSQSEIKDASPANYNCWIISIEIENVSLEGSSCWEYWEYN